MAAATSSLVILSGCAGTADGDRKDTGKPQAPGAVPTGQAASEPSSQHVPAGHTDYDFQRLAEQVRMRIDRIASDQRFHVLVEKPFIVIGDESRDMVRRRAAGTVRWAVHRLQKAYFANPPADIIEIWLFGDAASYRRNTQLFFGDNPDTPFGYYSPTHKALIMNIATGGGTLVHEIVHPFMRTNFPDCPAWFNEGMGSLYEQSAERDGDIIGLTNWRLEGLKRALRADTVPSFATLTATTDEEFYEADPGSNYAQARYLLYYLQEHGLLHDYYQRFVANADSDPTGYKTLQAVLGKPDMDQFFATWRDYVLALEFP